ncbi:unnamed protein product [Rotaria socialis]|uniref:Uncharacterized protein n=1 Tax=Rotaria socialis TaxID=392032 RepID=A0A817MS89_9BILA|nr:unnamed protein product [Rotaria socialis]CAF3519794.1 unnamed protein product [Rotaria socialis]CAF4342525.1 unnamed protein product [Rotaria socialis]CAF4433218.1 unnamed protein product [Rotaria socialis]
MNYSLGKTSVFVIAADYNNDSNMDLAVAVWCANVVSVLLGYGNGNFHTAINYMVGRVPSSDFNNDENLHLRVTNGSANTVSVLLGDGNGIFQSPMQYSTGRKPYYVMAADFNNDKKAGSGNCKLLGRCCECAPW